MLVKCLGERYSVLLAGNKGFEKDADDQEVI